MASIQEPIRFATFNASLNRNSEGQLITDLSTPATAQAQNVAEIIQQVNPDVVLINEFDYDADGTAAQLFQDNYLSVSQNGAAPVNYQYRYVAPSNTGIASGFDLNNNGSIVTTPGTPGYGDDALGFGNFPGQYGMVLYSKYPIDTNGIRTFQNFLWKDMSGALLPDDPNTPAAKDWYSPAELDAFRLSSKSHWDVPINVNGKIIHALVSHPTPPTFDGPEDRNGKRNHDEIRFWADYVTPGQGGYIYDDAGKVGGLTPGSSFAIMGDQNADPFDGDSVDNAIRQLLDNPLVNTSATPASAGGQEQAVLQGGANTNHTGNPAFDTADFADSTPGNLRVDYVLPSNDLGITNAAVFWPQDNDPLFNLVGAFNPNLPSGFPSSDHRLVWTDVAAASTNPQTTVTDVDFLGQATFPTGTVTVEGTQVGGLSGITYDASKGIYYSISDDRSQFNPARFYTLDIDLSQGSLSNAGVAFTDVTNLLDAGGQPFALNSLDPEGISLTSDGSVFISSEGDVNASPQINPFVNQFSLTGQQLEELPVPQKFLPTTGDSGIRNNLAFESLAITPDQKFLFTATENALKQDGSSATNSNGSPSRILQYNLLTGQPEKEFLYVTDPVTSAPNPPDSFSTNGLVELLTLDNSGTLLSLERSFSTGVGNSIKLYEVRLQGATDISNIDSLPTDLSSIKPAQKRLVLDLGTLKDPSDPSKPLTLDNIEGITFGPKLPDGRQSLVLVSDNNFSSTQITQVLALAINTETSTTPLLNRVASGDTTQDSTVLWARSPFLGPVTFEYSTDPDFSTVVTKTVDVTNPLQPVKLPVTGLNPGTDYYYRVTDAAGVTDVGQFHTAAPIGTQAGLRFGVSGDWRGELSPYPAVSNADERNLDFFVEHGDTIYADFPSPAVPVAQARTLQEYRAKQSEVYETRFGLNTLGDLRTSTSILATIDDHEVINDFAGGAPADSDPRFGNANGLVNDTQLYENGLQAFQEYNPLQDEFYGATGDSRTTDERQLYRFNTYGSDAAVFVLDARSFRDAELPPVNNPNDPAQVAEFLTSSFDPSRTMLGQQQLSELKQDLLQAQSDGITWKFIHVPEPIQNLGVVGASDRFEGYAAERTELLQFINENNIENVVFVAADIHGTVVNNLTYQEVPSGSQIPTGAFEVTTGSVAFDAPFGPTVIDLATDLGQLSPEQRASYDSLPREGKDEFLRNLIDNGLEPFGYDPVGLQNSEISATLKQGGYVAGQTYGWTEFEIEPQTQQLRVKTYGIDPYTEAELIANPGDIIDRTPSVVSEFVVDPKNSIIGSDSDDELEGQSEDILRGGPGNDVLDTRAGTGNNRLDGGEDNDILIAGVKDQLFGSAGEDILFAGKGGNTMTGGDGRDQFWIVAAETPSSANTISDFQSGVDVIGIGGLAGVSDISNLSITQSGGDTLINALGKDLVILTGIEANSLDSSSFVFS